MMARRAARALAASAVVGALTTTRTRILTYNIHAWRDSDHRDNFARVRETIQRIEPDFVCLNEVLDVFDGDAQPAEYWSEVAAGRGRGREITPSEDGYLGRLAQQLGFDHVFFAEAETAECFFGEVAFGNAILSRIPPVDLGEVRMRAEPGDVHLGDQKRDFVEGRSCCYATFDLADAPLTLASLHLDHKSEPLRRKQLSKVCEALTDKPNTVLLGDYNTFRRKDHSDEEWRGVVELYESRGWGAPAEESLSLSYLESLGFRDACDVLCSSSAKRPTCWTHDPRFRIDHVFFDSKLTASSSTTGDYTVHDSTASDHFPVSFDLPLFQSPS